MSMTFTPSPWPQLDELRRDLEAIAESPPGGIEPLLSQASLAVSRATTALTRAAGRRVRQAALDRAMELVEEARQAVARARLALAATDAQRTAR